MICYFKDDEKHILPLSTEFLIVLGPRWLRVSPQSSPSASLKCKSCPSWCHRSSLPRQRRTTCSGGRSLCGNPPGASVGRSPSPWRRGLPCSPSRPTCPAGGSTRHSPWCQFLQLLSLRHSQNVFFFPSEACEALFPAKKSPNSLKSNTWPPQT